MGIGDTEFNLAKIEVPIAPEDSARVVSAVLDLFSPLTEMAASRGLDRHSRLANCVLGNKHGVAGAAQVCGLMHNGSFRD